MFILLCMSGKIIKRIFFKKKKNLLLSVSKEGELFEKESAWFALFCCVVFFCFIYLSMYLFIFIFQTILFYSSLVLSDFLLIILQAKETCDLDVFKKINIQTIKLFQTIIQLNTRVVVLLLLCFYSSSIRRAVEIFEG